MKSFYRCVSADTMINAIPRLPDTRCIISGEFQFPLKTEGKDWEIILIQRLERRLTFSFVRNDEYNKYSQNQESAGGYRTCFHLSADKTVGTYHDYFYGRQPTRPEKRETPQDLPLLLFSFI